MHEQKLPIIDPQHLGVTTPTNIIMLGPSLTVNGGISKYEKLFLEHVPPEVKIFHIPTHKEGSSPYKIIVFCQALVNLLWMLLRKDIALVHIHISQRGSAFRKAIMTFLVWIFRKPIILHAHGSEFHLFYSQLAPWVQQLLRWVFGKCSRLIVLSESWKKFSINSLGLRSEQVVILYNPVKLPSPVPYRPGSQKVTILFLGRIGQRKGAFDLIKAFAALPAEDKNRASLILAGNGELEQAYSLVKSLELTANITIPGWVSSEERDHLLAKANIFILPSYNEGLPMAMLEAMGWGLPVITTPVGGIPELVVDGDNGLLVKPGEIPELSMAMQTLINDLGLRLSLGCTARASVAHLNIEDYCSSVLNIYGSVLKSEKTAP
ncbi:MAG: glycosyltransferase family 4 protein [Moorea sp. SIO3G5]|nr:glycosyltransferase family 4 protein [Moorena sp. SIO3G5]